VAGVWHGGLGVRHEYRARCLKLVVDGASVEEVSHQLVFLMESFGSFPLNGHGEGIEVLRHTVYLVLVPRPVVSSVRDGVFKTNADKAE
jgi:hypothetical protein